MVRGRLLPWLRGSKNGELGAYIVLSLAIAVFIGSVFSSLVRVEEDRRDRFANAGDGEWNAVQAVAQLEKFSALLERFLRGGGIDNDQLLAQYEILWSRFRIFISNPRNKAAGAIAAVQSDLIMVEAKLAELEPIVQALRPENADGYQRVDAFIVQLRSWLAELNRRVHAERVEADTNLGDVGRVYRRTFLYLALTILSTGILILQLVRATRRSTVALGQARAARVEAQAAQQGLHAVVDSVPAMIAAWSEDGRCLFANRLHAEFHGLAAERMTGWTVGELGLGIDLERTVAEVVRTGEPVPFGEHARADARGDERVLLSTLVPVHGEVGDVAGIVDVSLDITERKQRELALAGVRDQLEHQAQEMRQLADAAHRASQAKSLFLAMMSHEIRTPMNALLGFADLLASSPLPPEQRRQAGIVRETGRQLLAVLNDILDFTRIEEGKVEVERIPFRLDHLLESIRPVAEMLLGEKAVRFGLTIDPDVPPCVRGDPVRVKQVLTNLLSNAAKFTQRGSVQLAASSAPEEGPAFLRFAVTDTGIGINREQLPRLFQVFSQAEESTHRNFGGTGLGLAISRGLVERMGGRIGVEGEPGRGSTFWFVLHLESAAMHPHEARDPTPRRAAGAGRPLRILVVDDAVTNLQLLQALVQRAGHQTSTAADGVEALRAVERDPPDLVLMDINMPRMDGLEASRRIRKLGGSRGRVPIVALTAHAFASDVEACRAAGMDGHLTKPIDIDALEATLARYAAASVPTTGAPATGAPATVVAPDEPRPSTPDAVTLLDTARLESLVRAIGGEQVRSMFRQMIDVAARETTAMRRAYEAGERVPLAASARRLAKVGIGGASRLSTLAEAIELQVRAGPLDEAVDIALDEINHTRARTATAFEVWLSERRIPAGEAVGQAAWA